MALLWTFRVGALVFLSNVEQQYSGTQNNKSFLLNEIPGGHISDDLRVASSVEMLALFEAVQQMSSKWVEVSEVRKMPSRGAG